MSTDTNTKLTIAKSLTVLSELSSLVLAPDFSSSTRETCELAYAEAKDGSGIASMVGIINGTSIAPECYKMHAIYTILKNNPTYIELPYNEFLDKTGLNSKKVSENYHTDIIRTFKLLGCIKDPNLRNTYRDLNVATVIEFYSLRKRNNLDSILGDFLKEDNVSSLAAIEFKRKHGYTKSRSKKIDVSKDEDKKEDLPNNEDKSGNGEDDGDTTDSANATSDNPIGATTVKATSVQAATVGEIQGVTTLPTPPATIDLEPVNEDKPSDVSTEDDKNDCDDTSGEASVNGDNSGSGDEDDEDDTHSLDINEIISEANTMDLGSIIAILQAFKGNLEKQKSLINISIKESANATRSMISIIDTIDKDIIFRLERFHTGIYKKFLD